MSHTTANVFGALALAVADRVHAAVEDVAGHGASGPAALVALDGFAGGGSIDSLRRVLGITHSGAVRLVDRLVTAGLVERRIGSDARAVSVHLTPTGRRTARRVLTAREAALEQILARLSTAERDRLDPLLAALLEGIAGSPNEAQKVCRLCDGARCGHGTPRCPVSRGLTLD